jgi:hypothetical protein
LVNRSSFRPCSAALLIGLFLRPAVGLPTETARDSLFPQLRAGQRLTYLLRYHMQKIVKTESRVVTSAGPQNIQNDAQWLIHVEILEVKPQGGRATVRAKSWLETFDSSKLDSTASSSENKQASSPASQGSAAEKPGPDSKTVEFTVLPDGRTEGVKGLDALFSEQRDALQLWLRQFAIAGVFPRGKLKRGQKWESTEPEETPAPIAKLYWNKQGTYVRDEPCGTKHLDDSAPISNKPVTCAVILTSASLKQKGSPKDTTPGDYKLRDLKTMGAAKGQNETITYISLTSGLVVRVTEDAKQFMDVVIAKADGSNQVHYNIDGGSHTEISLVDSDPAQASTDP